MKVLVINAGSSSLKYQLMDPATGSVFAKGLCERIGIDGALTHKVPDKGLKYETALAMPTHAEAIQAVLNILVDPEKGVIGSTDEIDAVGHRVVHGGKIFTDSCLITDEVKKGIEACKPLAPLHNGANLLGIEACEKAMAGKPQVAVFDTAFHMTMPAKAYMYAVPYSWYDDCSVRRYGFHGTSHKYVAGRVKAILGTDTFKQINCHLGNGSSLSAILNGECQDTSMGLTPLAGVPMGTRCGDIDASVVQYMTQVTDMDMDTVINALNKKSGVLGLSEVSSAFRDLDDAAEAGNSKAALALDKFAYEVRKYIGSYAAALNGVDVITFTAGIGENSASMRARICEGLDYLGVKLDPVKNNVRGEEAVISADDSKVKVLVIPTNEELMIAQDTAALVR